MSYGTGEVHKLATPCDVNSQGGDVALTFFRDVPAHAR